MHRHDRAAQPEPLAQLGERDVGALLNSLRHAHFIGLGDLWLPAYPMVEVVDLADGLALAKELLDHAQRNAKPLGDILAGPRPLVVAIEYPLPEVE